MLKIRLLKAGIAQLVEHDLAKVGVASSSLVSRSRILNPAWTQSIAGFFIGCLKPDDSRIYIPQVFFAFSFQLNKTLWRAIYFVLDQVVGNG